MIPEGLESLVDEDIKKLARELTEYWDKDDVVKYILQTVDNYHGNNPLQRIRRKLTWALGVEKKCLWHEEAGNLWYAFYECGERIYGGVRYYHPTGVDDDFYICEIRDND